MTISKIDHFKEDNQYLTSDIYMLSYMHMDVYTQRNTYSIPRPLPHRVLFIIERVDGSTNLMNHELFWEGTPQGKRNTEHTFRDIRHWRVHLRNKPLWWLKGNATLPHTNDWHS